LYVWLNALWIALKMMLKFLTRFQHDRHSIVR
jgi:hypothetical protein